MSDVCNCDKLKKQTRVETMFVGSAPAESVCQAIEDAEIFVEIYGNTYSHDRYDVLVRYYAAHLLHLQGFAETTTSESVGPVSRSKQVATQGDKEDATPYIGQFRILLEAENEFITTV